MPFFHDVNKTSHRAAASMIDDSKIFKNILLDVSIREGYCRKTLEMAIADCCFKAIIFLYV